MLSFVDRHILSLLAGPMKRHLHISDTRVGLLQDLAFGIFCTFMELPLGRVADTGNRRNLIAAGVGVWSFFTSACSVARSFWSLFLMRMGVGVGEASLSASAYSLIYDYFPRERLGVAISVYLYYMGISFGRPCSTSFPTKRAAPGLGPVSLLSEPGGLSIDPLMPGLLNDRLFHDEKMIGPSMAITIAGAAVLMLVAFVATSRRYSGCSPQEKPQKLQ